MNIISSYEEIQKGINIRKAFDFGFDYPIEIKIINDEIYVSAEVSNLKGDIVGKISDNKWFVNPSPLVVYQKNYNSFAFEVIDSDNIPRLQVILRNNNKVYIGGLISKGNTSILLAYDTSILNPRNIDTIKTEMPRLFLYPIEDNPGKLNPEIYNIKLNKFWFEK